MMKFSPGLFLFAICFALGCSSQSADTVAEVQNNGMVPVNIKHAKGFTITRGSNYQLVEVLEPFKGSERGYKYLLVPRGLEPPADVEADMVIPTPVSSLATTSTSHLPALDFLGIAHLLAGFPNTDLISSRNIRTLVDQGRVLDIGPESHIDLESLIDISPELIIDFAMGSTYDQFETLQGTGIPVVLNADYMEETPLGRAEWIKFTAAFFDKEAEADSVFGKIEEN
ncbi:MAG: ABC transporter substrate-binding protein, partial [Cyclobacteriaceae bacterium]